MLADDAVNFIRMNANQPDETITRAGDRCVLPVWQEAVHGGRVPEHPIRHIAEGAPREDADDAVLHPAHQLLAVLDEPKARQLIILVVRTSPQAPSSQVEDGEPPIATSNRQSMLVATPLVIEHVGDVIRIFVEAQCGCLGPNIPALDCAIVVASGNADLAQPRECVDRSIMHIPAAPYGLVRLNVALLESAITTRAEDACAISGKASRSTGLLVRPSRPHL
mmetsp:Transcript_43568/g.114516  ORF Transcript_43568/g.114516 Transcript_43568/m.114516 type:complete len:222 (-) Transcript_43568:215-880(-)